MCMPGRWDHSAWFKLILLLKENFFSSQKVHQEVVSHIITVGSVVSIRLLSSPFWNTSFDVIFFFLIGFIIECKKYLYPPVYSILRKHFQQRICPDKHSVCSSSFSVLSKNLKMPEKPQHKATSMAASGSPDNTHHLDGSSTSYCHKKCVISVILRLQYQCHFEVGSPCRSEFLFFVSFWLSLYFTHVNEAN